MAKSKEVRRTGGCYQVTTGFRLLDISNSYGFDLLNRGKIHVVYPFGPDGPKRITDDEIGRLLGQGIAAQAAEAPPEPQDTPRRAPARKPPSRKRAGRGLTEAFSNP
jgi:hypothetical protein